MIRAPQDWIVTKRDGRTVPFDSQRIRDAVGNAFRAELQVAAEEPLEADIYQEITALSEQVVAQLANDATAANLEVEQIQDRVERELMSRGHFGAARRYIVYRAEHAKMRAVRGEITIAEEHRAIHVCLADETRVPFDPSRVRQSLLDASRDLQETVAIDELVDDVLRTVYDGITTTEIARALILATRSRIERDPAYDRVASRLMLDVIYREALGGPASAKSYDDKQWVQQYQRQFEHYLIDGIHAGRLSPQLRGFDLQKITAGIVPQRDVNFRYLGLQTIYDRYLLHVEDRRIETPQYFWMRVALGLALNEVEQREEWALRFYELLSQFRFTSATPTLFNSGTRHAQLSSCYLTTVDDDLEHIFKAIADNASLSKWAGGLGNDWTRVRATNAHISGTNGKSQGVIPFLKVVNDAAVAVNQGGKRKGAVCAYLETWHLDIEEFLDLRKNTGDDRRRTHDMHTANWIPDEFMRRVREGGQWTLFSPDEVPDLHDLYGDEFRTRYEHYEHLADEGQIEMFRRVSAVDLWRKMLTRLFETGHPWITFKDPSNIRSPQDHVGVVHSSNLCTEILLNTSNAETAVCNLGSVNLAAHVHDGELVLEELEKTIRVAVRMLDNVVDINFYPTMEAKQSNQQHRPIGLGLMGFQDALHAMDFSYASHDAVEFADRSMEAISYFAILASTELAAERGRYESYSGSKWDRGLLPIDTLDLLAEQREGGLAVEQSARLDWQVVREAVAKHGMRNSNVMAIAPTATISTIVGASQSIEPSYKHLYVKSNLSGEFTQVNERLELELKRHGLWDEQLLEELKYYDGSLQPIERIPASVRERFLTAFEVEPRWLIECAARRQKWIDQGQSLNLYLDQPNGRQLHDMYMLSWERGLKTTYYLRTRAATQVEKSTIDVNRFGIQPRWMKNRSESSAIEVTREVPATSVCSIDSPDCEACQ